MMRAWGRSYQLPLMVMALMAAQPLWAQQGGSPPGSSAASATPAAPTPQNSPANWKVPQQKRSAPDGYRRFEQECLGHGNSINQSVDIAGTDLGKLQTARRGDAAYNPLCDHARMLSEANNVYVVNYIYIERKKRLVEHVFAGSFEKRKQVDSNGTWQLIDGKDARYKTKKKDGTEEVGLNAAYEDGICTEDEKNSGSDAGCIGRLKQHLVDDGTCLKEDFLDTTTQDPNDVDLSKADGQRACLQRIYRQFDEAELDMRQKMVKHDRARYELEDDRQGPVGQLKGAKKPEDNIALKGLLRDSKYKPGGPVSLPPREIQFDVGNGRAAKRERDVGSTVNDPSQFRQWKDEKVGGSDRAFVEQSEGDKELQQKVEAYKRQNKQGYDADNRMMDNAANRPSQVTTDGTSWGAFSGTMSEVDRIVGDKDAAGRIRTSGGASGIESPNQKPLHLLPPLNDIDESWERR